ncbi:MAG: SprT-like domain-containing protein [Planctomycetota bacterium]
MAAVKDGLEEAARTRIGAELQRLATVFSEQRILTIQVRASRRLSASLARACPERAEIAIAQRLLPSVHLEEIVTHEVAHVLCYWRHGRKRPHGPEWRALVEQAGQRPSVRLRPSDVVLPATRRRRRRRGVLQSTREFLRSLL